MATPREQGYRPGLVDMAAGQISRELFGLGHQRTVIDDIIDQAERKCFFGLDKARGKH